MVGADALSWYENQPRLEIEMSEMQQERKTINQFFLGRTCIICGDGSRKLICDFCLQEKSRAVFLLTRHLGEIVSEIEVGGLEASAVLASPL